ncbi:MAG: GTPase [Alphaproteobacteria bacterium]|nr:GTPase [Alphaproteobacteria bacterium]
MRLKSFHGASLADAMRQVRETLGEDAIIVATRDDEMGGVRVTAAMDDALPKQESAPEPDDDILAHITDALHYHGVCAALSEKLLGTATHFAADDAIIALAAGFDAHMPFKPVALEPEKAGTKPAPIVLVGPPGAGKTLTVAKLATMARLQKKPVTVITTDLVRAGGVDQIAAFTRLLQIPLLEIEEPEAVGDTIAELSNKSLVIVDTSGRNPYHEPDRKELSRMIGKTPCSLALVLACGQDAAEGSEMARAFSSLGADRLILTRGDLTRRFGSMLNIAYDSGLALANLSASSNVTVPLQTLNPITLARCVMTPSALLQPQSARPVQTGTHA